MESKVKKPEAIVVLMVALSVNLIFVSFFIGLFFVHKHMPNMAQMIFFGLDVFALLGIINEYRWAYVAAGITCFFNMYGLELAGGLFLKDKILPAIVFLIGSVIPGVVTLFVLRKNSVRNYFQLNCPKCGQPGNVSYFYNLSKCNKCDVVW